MCLELIVVLRWIGFPRGLLGARESVLRRVHLPTSLPPLSGYLSARVSDNERQPPLPACGEERLNSSFTSAFVSISLAISACASLGHCVVLTALVGLTGKKGEVAAAEPALKQRFGRRNCDPYLECLRQDICAAAIRDRAPAQWGKKPGSETKEAPGMIALTRARVERKAPSLQPDIQ